MTQTQIRSISPDSKDELETFIRFDHHFTRAMPHYIPELDTDLMAKFTGQSAQFLEIKFQLYIAYDGNQPVGRCCALINYDFQKAKNTRVGSIGYFAALPGYQEQIVEMLKVAENWLREHKVTDVIAPFNGSVLLGLGLMSSYEDEQPMYPFKWHPRYYANYLIASGYNVSENLLFYTIKFNNPEFQRAKDVVPPSPLRIRELSLENWDDDISLLCELFNQCFKNEWQFHPFTTEVFHDFFGPLKNLLDTRQILVAEVNYTAVGFVLGLPDLNPTLRQINGQLEGHCLNLIKRQAKDFHRAGVIAVGVLPEYRGMKIAKSLVTQVFQFYETKGLKSAFYYPVNLRNYDSRCFAESLGGIGQEMYQCMTKKLGK